jgi:hypothetical protein
MEGMRVKRVISYNGGWDLLTQDAPDAWDDIQRCLGRLDREALQTAKKPFGGRYGIGVEPISAFSFQRAWDVLMEDYGWRDIRIASRAKGGLPLFVRGVKGKVSARMLTVDRMPPSAFATWLMVDVPRASDMSVSVLSVLLVPTEQVNALLTRCSKRSAQSIVCSRWLAVEHRSMTYCP